jgi:hypothetical protein
MSRRLLVALLLGAALVATPVFTDHAGAHAPRFTSCVAVDATTRECHHRGATFEVGRTVFFRGRVTPAATRTAEVWRTEARQARAHRVGTATVDGQGRVRWSWRPGPRDAHPEAPFTFGFRIPGVGNSDQVSVWIVPPHDPPVFRVCASTAATRASCHNGGVDYEVGRTVHLRGRITPAHPGFGQVLRRRPDDARFTVVGTIGIAEDGTTRWSWRTRARDVDRKAPYLFALRIPGLGRSNVVEVWVLPPFAQLR